MSCNRICTVEVRARSCRVHMSFHSSSVDWFQVSVCCIICHRSRQEKISCFRLRTSAFAISKDMNSDCCFQAGLPVNFGSILLLPKPPLALNNASRHADRDQLTLKLLDFTLKSPAPQMSAEFCRQFSLIHAQTLPGGMQGGEASAAWVMVHMSIQLLNFSVRVVQTMGEGT